MYGWLGGSIQAKVCWGIVLHLWDDNWSRLTKAEKDLHGKAGGNRGH